jgi:sterol desaturase/sphingolipid hydroxylase (fatty acid hydroxylase superfamily)
MRNQAPRLKLFESRWLESLTVISAPAFVALWSIGLVVIAWAAWSMAGSGMAMLLIPVGLLIWTMVEYALHRFLFHWKATSALTEQFVFIMHGNHHAAPNDPLRNLMPPAVSVPVAAMIWAIMVAVAGPAGHWVFLGFMAGYVTYDLVHYACHQWPMRGRIARALKLHHMRHHHLDETGNYAITGVIWDRVLRTRIARPVQR